MERTVQRAASEASQEASAPASPGMIRFEVRFRGMRRRNLIC